MKCIDNTENIIHEYRSDEEVSDETLDLIIDQERFNLDTQFHIVYGWAVNQLGENEADSLFKELNI